MSQMTGKQFAQLPLSAPTQRAIAEVLRYETLTKVQNDSIPPALAGESVGSVGWLLVPVQLWVRCRCCACVCVCVFYFIC